jgi:hypothetical protein
LFNAVTRFIDRLGRTFGEVFDDQFKIRLQGTRIFTFLILINSLQALSAIETQHLQHRFWGTVSERRNMFGNHATTREGKNRHALTNGGMKMMVTIMLNHCKISITIKYFKYMRSPREKKEKINDFQKN